MLSHPQKCYTFQPHSKTGCPLHSTPHFSRIFNQSAGSWPEMFLLAIITLLLGYALCIQCSRSRYSSKRSSVSIRSQTTSSRKPKKEIKPTITSACCEAGGTTANQDRISVKPLR
uniref:Uncharacterized protein n=1 Tax=Bursaphelenchus xylophilus TaxID=6326 RepID=A0A1I7S0W7_BURXY